MNRINKNHAVKQIETRVTEITMLLGNKIHYIGERKFC